QPPEERGTRCDPAGADRPGARGAAPLERPSLSGRPGIRGAVARLRSRIGRRQPAPRPDTIDVGPLFRWCLEQGLDTRPQYLWGTLVAARTARGLGIPAFTAIEFGVAGGNGLLALERAAAEASE